jgi:hypothetical protein
MKTTVNSKDKLQFKINDISNIKLIKETEIVSDNLPETEKTLQILQENFLISRQEVYINKMYKILFNYAKSLLIKNFRPYLVDIKDLKYKAHLAVTELIIQYYLRAADGWKIGSSFGSYLTDKIRQVVFSKKYDLSNNEYIKICSKKIDSVKDGEIYSFLDMEKIKPGSMILYIYFFNKEFGYWENGLLLAKDDKKGKFYQLSDFDYLDLENSGVDYKNKSFIITFNNKFNPTTMKVSLIFKSVIIKQNISLDAVINSENHKCFHDLISILNPLRTATHMLGEIKEEDDIVDNIMYLLHVTGGDEYCDSRKINLHRIIAIRNRLLKGENYSDIFFKTISNESRYFYEQTMSVIYQYLTGSFTF